MDLLEFAFLGGLLSGSNRLRPGNLDGERCHVCEEDGACHEWAQNMANDARVPLRWLVNMTLDGYIDHDWSVEEVKELFSGG